jgi:ectoine hydroxylase-related dioxygenase (phytanoyl-CoA dioxygenase family)
MPSNPQHKNFDHRGFVHWDLDPWEEEIPFGLQGVLALEDTEENQGGFHCVPGMHKYLREYIKKVPSPPQRERFHTHGVPINVPKPALQRLKLQKIPAKKGDLVIWRRELAHGNGHNVSSSPRLAQYINMYPHRPHQVKRLTPQESLHPEPKYERIKMYQSNSAAANKPGDIRRFEENHPPANLTDLGKRILGLDSWDEDAE